MYVLISKYHSHRVTCTGVATCGTHTKKKMALLWVAKAKPTCKRCLATIGGNK